MDRIIFLDIDGVLNDINDMKNDIALTRRLYNMAYPNLGEDYDQMIRYIGISFSFEKLEVLRKIISLTDAKIVLTSSFRSDLVVDALIHKNIPVVGMVPYLRQNRSKEIKEYLRDNQCCCFCIIDDEVHHYDDDLLDYLVRTDGYNYNGLSCDEILEVAAYYPKTRILK